MDLVLKVRDEINLESNITTSLYGVINQSRAEKLSKKPRSWRPERVGNVDTEKIRDKSLNIVKTFNVIKNVIWQSAIEVDEND